MGLGPARVRARVLCWLGLGLGNLFNILELGLGNFLKYSIFNYSVLFMTHTVISYITDL